MRVGKERREFGDGPVFWYVWGAEPRRYILLFLDMLIDATSGKESSILLLLSLQFEEGAFVMAWDHSTAGLTDELSEALGAAEPVVEETELLSLEVYRREFR